MTRNTKNMFRLHALAQRFQHSGTILRGWISCITPQPYIKELVYTAILDVEVHGAMALASYQL